MRDGSIVWLSVAALALGAWVLLEAKPAPVNTIYQSDRGTVEVLCHGGREYLLTPNGGIAATNDTCEE